MNQRNIVGLVCGLLLFIPMVLLGSQITNHKSLGFHPWWVDIGAGPSLIGSAFAMNAGMIYCYQFERSIISARILGITNKNPTVQRIDHSSITYKMTDYGILYGPIWQSECGYISVGAGIGLVRATYESPINITSNTSISLPLEIQWFWRPTRFVGVGVYTFTSLNFEKPLYGVMLCAQLGMW